MNHKNSIVIISQNEADLQEYSQKVLLNKATTVECFSSLQEFQSKLGRDHYQGFIVDVRSISGASREEKFLLFELENTFPFLRIAKEAGTNRVHGLVGDKVLENDEVFDFFVEKKCRPFRGRGVRVDQRRLLHLNLKVCFSGAWDLNRSVRANTLDVSKRGMFIVTTEQKTSGDVVWLIIEDLANKAPMQGVVRWCIEWGKSMEHMPGIGVEITPSNEAQSDELIELMKKARVTLA